MMQNYCQLNGRFEFNSEKIIVSKLLSLTSVLISTLFGQLFSYTKSISDELLKFLLISNAPSCFLGILFHQVGVESIRNPRHRIFIKIRIQGEYSSNKRRSIIGKGKCHMKKEDQVAWMNSDGEISQPLIYK